MADAKQTAANSALLATLKWQWNEQIYRQASKLMNSDGPDATIEYIGQFFNAGARPPRIEELRALVGKAPEEHECTRCFQPLDGERAVWLELNGTTSRYHRSGGVAEADSQGEFVFGAACARRVLKNGGRV